MIPEVRALSIIPEISGLKLEKPSNTYRQAESLPTELLLDIFQGAHEDNQTLCYLHGCKTCQSAWAKEQEPPLHQWASLDILKDTSPEILFPFNIAQVCSDWRAIISSIPGYWTRLVIPIDADPVRYLRYLRCSRNLDIEVMVTRNRPDGDVPQDPFERSRVAVVLEGLVPHLRRIKSLRIHALHSSSLPSFIQYLFDVKDLHSLGFLELSSVLDDSPPLSDEEKNANDIVFQLEKPKISRAKFTRLTGLHLNGHNFRLLHKANVPTRRILFSKILELTISNFTSKRSELTGEYIGLVDMLQTLGSRFLPKMVGLRLCNIRFDEQDEDWPHDIPYELNISNLLLEDMGQDILRTLQFLADIREDRSVCPKLDFISITDCPDIITDALKRLIKNRNASIASDEDDGLMWYPICELQLRGNIPKLPSYDRNSFGCKVTIT